MRKSQTQTAPGVDVGVKVIIDRQEPGYNLLIELHKGEMECRGSLRIKDPDQALLSSELIRMLRQFVVDPRLDEDAVAVFCSEAIKTGPQEKVLLGKGKEPTKGADGWFEFNVRTSDAEAEFEEDEQGNVDLRTRHTFSNIEPGTTIGTIHPPEAGEPGETVTGKTIPALVGDSVMLVAGDGVVLEGDGLTAVATKAGRAIFEKNVLSISEEYIIQGDLDLSVGNIDFNGYVEVRGDVLDDFTIKSTKGIKVSGAVGASLLETDGSVEIGSMAGTDRGLIRCRGTLTAHHLNGVKVECHGHVKVTTEIRNSIVKSAGRVSVERGIIAGGETVALEGIEARQIGALSGLATRLISGVYFPEEDQLEKLRKSIASTEEQISRIRTVVGPLRHSTTGNKALADAVATRVRVLGKRLTKLEENLKVYSQDLAGFKRGVYPSANAKINVGQLLLEGTKIKLGKSFVDIQQEQRRPVSIIENTRGGGLRYLSLTPLRVAAEDLEQEALASEEEPDEKLERAL